MELAFEDLSMPLGSGAIPEDEAILIAIAMATVRQDISLLHPLFGYAFRNTCRPEDIQEILLQTHLFAGVPVVINAFQAFRSYCKDHGIAIPRTTHQEIPRDELRRRGRGAFDIIYQDKADAIISSIAEAHEEFAEFIMCDAYGRILTRETLSLRLRELSVVNVLLTLNITRQMVGHMRGALRCGASADEIEASLKIAQPYVGDERLDHALSLFERAGQKV